MNNTFDNNFKKGCFAALGIPGISLAASFFALGALFKNSGLNAIQSFLSTLIGFALPGQVVMAETLIVNGTLLNILIAVFLTNARLYPMTVNLVPVIRQKVDRDGIIIFWHILLLSLVGFICFLIMIKLQRKVVLVFF
ncbi:MAG: AzlC family ABC transporter permease [Candidatus Fonsibacter sp.]